MFSLPPVHVGWMPNFLVLLLLVYLILGLLFFLFNHSQLMLISFGCCAALSLFIKMRTDADLVPPLEAEGKAVVRIAHFNSGALNAHLAYAAELIRQSGVDVLAVDEVDITADSALREALRPFFPYHFSLMPAEDSGVAIYSRFRVEAVDTICHYPIQMFSACLEASPGGDYFQFLTFHTYAGFSWKDLDSLSRHLNLLKSEVVLYTGPQVLAGNFYILPWSDQMQQFRLALRLNDSRQGRKPINGAGYLPLWEVPLHQVFFSDHFTCLDFFTFRSESAQHLGIMSVLQFR